MKKTLLTILAATVIPASLLTAPTATAAVTPSDKGPHTMKHMSKGSSFYDPRVTRVIEGNHIPFIGVERIELAFCDTNTLTYDLTSNFSGPMDNPTWRNHDWQTDPDTGGMYETNPVEKPDSDAWNNISNTLLPHNAPIGVGPKALNSGNCYKYAMLPAQHKTISSDIVKKYPWLYVNRTITWDRNPDWNSAGNADHLVVPSFNMDWLKINGQNMGDTHNYWSGTWAQGEVGTFADRAEQYGRPSPTSYGTVEVASYNLAAKTKIDISTPGNGPELFSESQTNGGHSLGAMDFGWNKVTFRIETPTVKPVSPASWNQKFKVTKKPTKRVRARTTKMRVRLTETCTTKGTQKCATRKTQKLKVRNLTTSKTRTHSFKGQKFFPIHKAIAGSKQTKTTVYTTRSISVPLRKGKNKIRVSGKGMKTKTYTVYRRR